MVYWHGFIDRVTVICSHYHLLLKIENEWQKEQWFLLSRNKSDWLLKISWSFYFYFRPHHIRKFNDLIKSSHPVLRTHPHHHFLVDCLYSIFSAREQFEWIDFHTSSLSSFETWSSLVVNCFASCIVCMTIKFLFRRLFLAFISYTIIALLNIIISILVIHFD